jgi:hypothetical protein
MLLPKKLLLHTPYVAIGLAHAANRLAVTDCSRRTVCFGVASYSVIRLVDMWTRPFSVTSVL